ncbi:MAG: ribosome-associated translation inhibitor RaiA [Chloroflexi bacterium]|nr:ribosome-associated translation inhibitor RaiA [Chloroflexota bacterium]
MALDVKIFVRDIKLTDRIHDYVEKKVSKLDRYLSDINDARVDLAFIKSARDANDRYVAQITIRGKGFVLRAEERADDIFSAFDMALPKVQRRMRRFKGKHFKQRNGSFEADEVIADMFEMLEDDIGPEIVRRKHFMLTPMNELEAIEQMDLLGHELFFIFLSANTGQINVLYKRHDGRYGIIEPEIA